MTDNAARISNGCTKSLDWADELSGLGLFNLLLIGDFSCGTSITESAKFQKRIFCVMSELNAARRYLIVLAPPIESEASE